MVDSNNSFEVLISKFNIVFNKLQIQGYHGAPADPRRHKTVSPLKHAQMRWSTNPEHMIKPNHMYKVNKYNLQSHSMMDSQAVVMS